MITSVPYSSQTSILTYFFLLVFHLFLNISSLHLLIYILQKSPSKFNYALL
nr:MAG TPA: hypothetical protein [Caudoviricetes sp.]